MESGDNLVRWILIGFFLLNAIYLLWNGVEYGRHQDYALAGSSTENARVTEMPGSKLVLLSESVATAKKSSEAVSGSSDVVNGAISPVSPAAEQGEQAECVLLGPFADKALAQPLLVRMASMEIHSKLVAVEIADAPDYWVYLKPEASRELAVSKLRELQEKKIDGFIIPQGELANGISLGVFDNQENADRRRQAVVDRGYDVQVRSNPRIYIENWVAINPDDARKFSNELYEQLHGENGSLNIRKDQCSKVASVGNIQ